MQRLILIACAALLALPAGMSAGLSAAWAQTSLTDWKPVCICKSGHPRYKDRITAVFRITDKNKAGLKKKIDQGRLGLRQYATLHGKACGEPKISGPVTVRINMLSNAPSHRPKGKKRYELNERFFKVGRRFRIGGKPVSRDEARVAVESANRVTVWRPTCICRSGHPDRKDRITAVFRITDKNQAEMKRKLRQGRLGLGQKARLEGAACDRPKLCGTTYDFKTKERYPNTPIAGPVSVRINMLVNAPVKRPRGALLYRLVEKRFHVGKRFKIGGKPQ
ncbi:MAG: hypothetical protein P8Z76_13120 [Alphaproteobacteria bacterium]